MTLSEKDHTFIIPAYKDSVFLEDCIKSLKRQTVPGNIIITTSTPSDFIAGIAREYNIEMRINIQRGGIAGDWNFGLSVAKTKLVTIAHQDDVYDKNFLDAVLQKWNCTDQNVLIFFTDYDEIIDGAIRKNSLNLIIKKILLFPFIFQSCIHSKFFKKFPLLFGNPICCPSVTYNIEELADFTFLSEYAYNLDWSAWLELSRRDGAFVRINKKLMKHRLHHGSETSKQLKTDIRKKEELKIFETIWGKVIARFLALIYLRSHKDNIL